ncbi:cyanoexosortase B [Aphanothece hegewaldii CCALA 016]|uniref:Cyanoexosortase B n=1 Tax=Aphanothece hegewaldii CCALA 016 TaxID=2107694 RepID=A0A2T1M1N9_9CHRO|nr:cyanoexosortase B [Aphanothece hegewaldii]PSF38629.1 cyanoexosortase B [Aphanothece hegewaldii CCALA 016]
MQTPITSATERDRNLFIFLVLGLLAILYGPLIVYWFDGWLNKSISIEHEYFSHGLIGLPYAAYITWQQRKQWQRLPNVSHPLGLSLLVLGGILYFTGLFQWVNLSFVIMLIGVCLWLKGKPGLKLQWFPLLLVFLATPNEIPYLITPYTLPLQKFIANVAGFILQQLGFEVAVQGIHLAVQGQFVEVAPYCAGLKMLFTSIYVTLLLLHWTNSLKNRKKVFFMLISAVIISITANVFRNAILAGLHGIERKDLFDLVHEGWGGDLYSVLMLLTIVGLFRLLQKYETTNKPEQMKVEDKQYE